MACKLLGHLTLRSRYAEMSVQVLVAAKGLKIRVTAHRLTQRNLALSACLNPMCPSAPTSLTFLHSTEKGLLLPAVTRRLGGAFGGKINSAARVAGFAAMAAVRLGERVSCAVSRDDDLRMHAGGLHARLSSHHSVCVLSLPDNGIVTPHP